MVLTIRRLFVAVFCLASANAFCDSPIFCKGVLLDTLQRAMLEPDSKTLVDMPLKEDPSIVLQNFLQLSNHSSASLKSFVQKYFDQVGSDVIPVVPEDWNPSPSFLNGIADQDLSAFGLFVHGIWKDLAKKFDHSKYCSECYSSIEVEFPFVVAGDRFREYYYWDSYWIIKGLLVSNMFNTSKGMISNALSLVETYGFVPNGGRIYYLNRSQPPMLIQMVAAYFQATKDLDFIVASLPTLEKEYQFWMNNRSMAYAKDGHSYNLNRFDVDNTLPRPEGYMTDINASKGMNLVQSANFYGQVATAAESGEDFSSAWFVSDYNFTTINTKNVLPVGLNTILLKNEFVLADLFALAGDIDKSNYYYDQAGERLLALMSVFYDDQRLQWFDVDMWTNTKNSNFYATNWMPLWALGEFLDESQTNLILENMMEYEEGFQFPAGVPTSLYNTTEQWDFPNTWAPLMYFIIEGLESMNSTTASEFAVTLAQRWITTTYCGWKKHGVMFEKYDVTRIGETGGGGEYHPQAGFGWTNGFTLHLLNTYGQILKSPQECF